MIEKAAILLGYRISRVLGCLTFELHFRHDDGGEQKSGMYSLGDAKWPGTALVVLIDRLLKHFGADRWDELKNLPCYVKVGVLGNDKDKITGFRSFGQRKWIMFADVFKRPLLPLQPESP